MMLSNHLLLPINHLFLPVNFLFLPVNYLFPIINHLFPLVNHLFLSTNLPIHLLLARVQIGPCQLSWQTLHHPSLAFHAPPSPFTPLDNAPQHLAKNSYSSEGDTSPTICPFNVPTTNIIPPTSPMATPGVASGTGASVPGTLNDMCATSASIAVSQPFPLPHENTICLCCLVHQTMHVPTLLVKQSPNPQLLPLSLEDAIQRRKSRS